MTPAAARADEARAPGCYVGYAPTTVAPAARCRFGAPDGDRVIALVGDSHATQWLPAFDAAAAARGWTVYFWAKSQCPITDVPVWVGKLGSRYRACETWRRALYQRLASLRGLDAVYVGRWAQYQEIAVDGSGRRLHGSALDAAWRAGTERMAAALDHAPRLVVLRDTPWPDADVPSCLSRHAGQPERCAFPRAGHAGRDVELAAAEAAARTGGRLRHLAGAADVVCPGRRCPVVTRQGVIMYRDSHHLTATFSALLADVVGREVARTLA